MLKRRIHTTLHISSFHHNEPHHTTAQHTPPHHITPHHKTVHCTSSHHTTAHYMPAAHCNPFLLWRLDSHQCRSPLQRPAAGCQRRNVPSQVLTVTSASGTPHSTRRLGRRRSLCPALTVAVRVRVYPRGRASFLFFFPFILQVVDDTMIHVCCAASSQC